MKHLLEFACAIDLIQRLGIKIIWTTQRTPLACYLQETNEIVLNKTIFKSGRAVPLNFKMFAHVLFHELGHAVLWHWQAVPPAGPFNNLPEEVWCDKFASELCILFGLKGTEQFEAYVKRFGS